MRLTVIHPPADSVPAWVSFGPTQAAEARAFHRTLPDYAPTPLVSLSALANQLGIRALLVKDESHRFGLNAFKALGGSFAMHAVLAEHPGVHTFVTATDGNHGRGVAWAARQLGQQAVVYLPRGSARERLENIRALGARAEITDLNYDDCVRFARQQAEQHGWILLQDTAWEGYETIPARIMQGYTTMGAELTEQLGQLRPTHVFLQAGVGAMAGAITGFLAEAYSQQRPTIVIVEPEGADCIFRTAAADDGTCHFCPELNTIMAGLSCGEPCTIGWDILHRHADFVLACPDAIAEDGMRLLAHPADGDPAIVSGESGAVTVGAAAFLMRGEAEDIRTALGLDNRSVVLCISTEGDTDHDNWLRITGGIGAQR